MSEKPSQLTAANADAFQDPGVADAYRYRPPYPAALFDALAGLVTAEPRHALDAGCGDGSIARRLVAYVDRLDAVDASRSMIESGRRLPHGDDPRLRWLHGRIEDVALDPPYALITAGDSIHWMDWPIALPRLRQALAPGAYLAIVERAATPDPWSLLGEVVSRYRVDGGYRPFDVLARLEQQQFFRRVGEAMFARVPFAQPIDEVVESYHSRPAFSRERLGAARAAAFDADARDLLRRTHGDGMVAFMVGARVVWGVPGS
jgi:SAM-dependent methyltransferase